MVVIKGHGPFRGIFDGGKSTTTPSSISKPDFAKVLSKEQAVSGLRAVEQGTTPKTTGFADRLIREDPAFRNALANLAEGLRGNGSPALDEMANRIVDQVEKGGTKIG